MAQLFLVHWLRNATRWEQSAILLARRQSELTPLGRMLFLSLKHQNPFVYYDLNWFYGAVSMMKLAATTMLESLSPFNASLFYFPVFTYNASNKETCEHNHGQCSRHAFCTDYATGFCCHCQSRFYGNGKHCLPAGEELWLGWGWGLLPVYFCCLLVSSCLCELCLWTSHLHRLNQRGSNLQVLNKCLQNEHIWADFPF